MNYKYSELEFNFIKYISKYLSNSDVNPDDERIKALQFNGKSLLQNLGIEFKFNEAENSLFEFVEYISDGLFDKLMPPKHDIRLFSGISLDEGEFTIKLTPDIIPYLLEIKSRFHNVDELVTNRWMDCI